MTEFEYGPVDLHLVGFEGDRPDPGTLEAIGELIEGRAAVGEAPRVEVRRVGGIVLQSERIPAPVVNAAPAEAEEEE